MCARRRARRCGKVGHLLEGGRLRGPSQRRQWSEPGIWPVSPPTLPLFVRRGGAVFARVHLRKAQPCARGGRKTGPTIPWLSGASWDATRRFLGGRFLGLSGGQRRGPKSRFSRGDVRAAAQNKGELRQTALSSVELFSGESSVDGGIWRCGVGFVSGNRGLCACLQTKAKSCGHCDHTAPALLVLV